MAFISHGSLKNGHNFGAYGLFEGNKKYVMYWFSKLIEIIT